MGASWLPHALAALQAFASLAEPAVPPPPELRIAPGQTGERFQVNFPAEAHAGDSRGTYWLTGDERLVADIQLSVDVDGKAPVRVIGALVIDGVQVRLRTKATAAARAVERTVVPGRVDRFQISVDAARVAIGTHWAALLFWQADGHRFPGWSFAIVKNGARQQRAPGACPFRLGPADRDDVIVYMRRPVERLLFGRSEPVRPAADGSAGFDMHFAESASADAPRARSHTVLAFLDGKQVPFDRTMIAPTAELSPGVAADARLTVQHLPGREEGHLLILFLVTREKPPGQQDVRSDWQAIQSRQLGGLVW
jgi:hypothetical protein